MELSVVVPLWNEVGSVEYVINEILEQLGDTCELTVVCVDDGSSDGTASKLALIALAHSRVRVATHQSRQGYGSALATGFSACNTRLVGYIDGDGQYFAEDLGRLASEISGDVVAALGVRQDRADPVGRRLLGGIGTLAASLICGRRFRDVNAGLKVFDAQQVPLCDLLSTGGYISTELIKRAMAGGRVVEVSVRHRPRRAGSQSGGSLKTLARLAVDAGRARSK